MFIASPVPGNGAEAHADVLVNAPVVWDGRLKPANYREQFSVKLTRRVVFHQIVGCRVARHPEKALGSKPGKTRLRLQLLGLKSHGTK